MSGRDTRFTSALWNDLHAAQGASLVFRSQHHHNTTSKAAWLRMLGYISSAVYVLLHMLCYIHLQAYARLYMLGNIFTAAIARHSIFGYVHWHMSAYVWLRSLGCVCSATYVRVHVLGYESSAAFTWIRKLGCVCLDTKLGCVCLDTKARLRLLGYKSSILSDVLLGLSFACSATLGCAPKTWSRDCPHPVRAVGRGRRVSCSGRRPRPTQRGSGPSTSRFQGVVAAAGGRGRGRLRRVWVRGVGADTLRLSALTEAGQPAAARAAGEPP